MAGEGAGGEEGVCVWGGVGQVTSASVVQLAACWPADVSMPRS